MRSRVSFQEKVGSRVSIEVHLKGILKGALLRLKQAWLDFWRGQSQLAPAKRRWMARIEHFP